MENFGKHIYKKTEYQISNEKNVTPEQIEYSERAAKEKLEKILSPDFKNFAVRYMNIEEYRELMENEKISGQFIAADGLHNDPESFSEFLTEFGTARDTEWQLEQTNWEDISGITVLETANLIEQIKHIEKENKGKNLDKKNQIIRDYLLQYLHSWKHDIPRYIKKVDANIDSIGVTLGAVDIEDFKEYHNQNRIDFIPEDERKKLREDFLDYVSQASSPHRIDLEEYAKKKQSQYNCNDEQSYELVSYLRSIKRELDFGAENLKIIQDFKDNPDFLKQKDGLRKIITALGNIHSRIMISDEHRQYHLALIVDENIVSGEDAKNQWGFHGWRWISAKKLDSDKLRSGILGVISIYPLKEMYREILEIEKGSGNLAHPVFDNKGIVRWPK